MNDIVKFEIGKTYNCRSITDSNCRYEFTIVKRTEKTVSFNYENKTVTKKVTVYDSREIVFPLGKYSMAPIIKA